MTREERKIRRVIREFAHDMLQSMLSQMEHGRCGWDDNTNLYWRQHGGYEAILCSRLKRHNASKHKDNEVDDANHLMMLKYLREKDNR